MNNNKKKIKKFNNGILINTPDVDLYKDAKKLIKQLNDIPNIVINNIT